MPVAPPLAASARSLLVAGLPTVAHPAERAAVITIKIATVTRTPRAPSKQPHRTEEYRPKVLPDTLTLASSSGQSSTDHVAMYYSSGTTIRRVKKGGPVRTRPNVSTMRSCLFAVPGAGLVSGLGERGLDADHPARINLGGERLHHCGSGPWCRIPSRSPK